MPTEVHRGMPGPAPAPRRGWPPPARLAVLGLLVEHPTHRYDVACRLRERVGSAWDVKNPQVYHDVNALVQEGLVERVEPEDDAAGRRLEATGGSGKAPVYRPTPRGRQEFEAWLSSDSTEEPQPVRNSLAMRLAFLAPDRVPALLKLVSRREHAVLMRIRERSETCPELDQSQDAPDYEGVGVQLILEGTIAALQAELRWLRRVRGTLESIVGPREGERP